MHDKVVVVVGATGGIGSALTRKLASTGASLVLAARDSARLATLAAELPIKVLTVPTDITDSQQVDTLIEKAIDRIWSNRYIGKCSWCWHPQALQQRGTR